MLTGVKPAPRDAPAQATNPSRLDGAWAHHAVMAFDSLNLAAAAALFGAGVTAWILAAPYKSASRLYLRFAAMLLAALSVTSVVGLGDIGSLFLLPLASTSLALSALARFARGLRSFAATLALVASLGGGLAAMLSGMWILALLPVALASLVIAAASLNSMALVPALSGIALLAGGLAILQQGAQAGALLFLAAGLIGLSRRQLLRSTSKAWRGAAVP